MRRCSSICAGELATQSHLEIVNKALILDSAAPALRLGPRKDYVNEEGWKNSVHDGFRTPASSQRPAKAAAWMEDLLL